MNNTIEKHIILSKKQRQSHIDLSSPCIPAIINRGKDKGKIDKYARQKAKQSLLDYLNMEKFNGNIHKIHTCHVCPNDSQSPNGFTCINSKHLYFGTISENNLDKSAVVRKKIFLDNHKKAIANGNHISQQTHSCPRCKRELGGPKAISHIKNGTKGCPL